jgi:DNA anti-recombination protein RmuC
MDWATIVPVAGIALTVVGGIVVERIKARGATKKEIADAVDAALGARLTALDKRVAKVETLEDADKAKLIEDVSAIGRDLSVLRGDHDRRWTEEQQRRERSAERLERRDKDEREKHVERERRLERLSTQVENILEALRDRRR